MIYIQWTAKGGGVPLQLFFDSVLDQTSELTSEITQHPVEVGANVTDHVREEVDQIKLEVFVSNEPARDVNNRGGGFQTSALDIPDLPTPTLSVGGLVSGAFNTLQNRSLDRNATTFRFTSQFNAVSDTLSILEELKGKIFVDVITTDRDYHNMILQGITQKKSSDTGTGATFTLEFKQIRLVETKIVKAPIPTESRGQKTINKGAQGPKPAKDQPKKKSVLKTLLGAAFA